MPWPAHCWDGLLGYGTAGLIAAAIARQSAIPIAITYLGNLEVALWLLPLALGLLAGLLPAWQAYRVNVVEKLFPWYETTPCLKAGVSRRI